MRVVITKDCIDGSRSQAGTFNLDGLSVQQLVFMLTHADVASITITKADLLSRLDRLEEGPQDEETED